MGREQITQTCSNCGAVVDGEQFCPECGQWVDNLADEVFEPFSLEEGPPPDDDLAYAPHVEAPPEVTCPSCGTLNPAYNRHCEECGARLGQAPLPVAPQPMIRTTAGARALMVLAAVILVVALLALLVNLFRSPGEEVVAGAETEGTTTTSEAPTVRELAPLEVSASSSTPGFEPQNLIDEDPSTVWNDASLQGQGAELTFRFGEPVQITSIVLYNLDEETRFLRNYRIRGYQIVLDDLTQTISGELQDTQEPQTIQVPSLQTTVVTIKVQSTYPAQAVGDLPPFSELALQQVKFFGRPNP